MMRWVKRQWGVWLACLVILQLIACTPSSPGASSPTSFVAPTLVASTPTSKPITTPTVENKYIFVPGYIPPALIKELNLPEDIKITDDPSIPALARLQVGTANQVASWVYVLVAPFATVPDEVSLEDLNARWTASPEGNFPAERIVISSESLDLLSWLWGIPNPLFVDQEPAEQILDECWKSADAWTILPFEELQPQWKVIAINGQNPIRPGFSPATYPLNLPFSLVKTDENGSADFVARLMEGSDFETPVTNYHPDRMTSLVLTGVTAMVRATGAMMDLQGNTYPATDIRGELRAADILHINNEIPFTPRCPPGYDPASGLVFCSPPDYIELLEDIGTDVVELTGDHFQDWGTEAVLYTLELYREQGWQYYGGGEDLEDAQRPVLIEHNGNRIALIGCNAKAPGYSSAAENTPGALRCDFDWLSKEVKKLKADGYLPVVTYQHEEVWTYKVDPFLQPAFHTAADAGAVIVSGSQAHQPQGFEFRNGSLLHYGLGNLFFDQYYEGLPNRQAFIDRHVFYEGRHISTELLTIMFTDYAHSRWMTPEERAELLSTIFAVSIWNESEE